MAHKTGGHLSTKQALRGNTREASVQYTVDANVADDDVCFLNTTQGSLEIRKITYRPSTAGTDGSAVTLAVLRAADGEAVGSGTAVHSGTINLKGTVDTAQDLTITSSAKYVDKDEALILNLTGTATAVRGLLSIDLIPA